MAKPKKASSNDFHLRILKVSTVENLDRVLKDNQEKGLTKNELINRCIDLALPAIEKDLNPSPLFAQAVNDAKTEILEAVTSEFRKTRMTLAETSISQYISEHMVGAVYQLVQHIIQNSDAQLPEQLKDRYDENIPAQFDNLKRELIAKLND